MGNMDDLRVRQLDKALKPYQALRQRQAPDKGWIRTIRETLGMSLRQLAERADLSKTSVTNAEQTERRGTVQLETLQKLADAMDCDLVYALVPRQSLKKTIHAQATRIARTIVGRVSESMELEDQAVPDEDARRQIDEMIEELLRNRPRDFWDA